MGLIDGLRMKPLHPSYNSASASPLTDAAIKSKNSNQQDGGAFLRNPSSSSCNDGLRIKPLHPSYALFLLGGKHHHHLPPFHLGKLLHNSVLIKIGSDPLHHLHAYALMCNLATTEAQGNFGLVAFAQEADQITQLDVVISIIGTRPELDFLDLDLLLFKLGLVLLLALGIFEFADIHDAAHRRFRHGRNFNQVQISLLSQPKRLCDCHYT